MISVPAEGILVLYSILPYFLPFHGDVFRGVIVICDLYVSQPRLAIDHSNVRQFIWENALDTIEFVSFLDAAEGA